MHRFLGDPESGLLNLEAHCLALTIAKKTLDENCFRTAQKTTHREAPSFQIGDRVYFKNKQPGKWDLKWRHRYQIVHIECDGYYIHTENQVTGKTRSCKVKDIVLEPPVELWNIIWQSREIYQPSCKFTNDYTSRLKMNKLLYIVTCK